MVGLSKGAPGQIANVFNAFLFNRAMVGSLDHFCSQIPYVKFYKVYFGGRNVLAHSLIGIRCENIEVVKIIKNNLSCFQLMIEDPILWHYEAFNEAINEAIK